jgi:tetratricopeptide (TPR) repeat protein
MMDSKIEALRKLSAEIDALYDCGKNSEGETLLRKALEESKDIEAYHLFFQGEVEGYLNKNYEAQQKLFEQANALEKDDYFLMRNSGVSLSNQGKETKAMEWFAKALAANPKDYASMRNMGVSLSNQGKEMEAMEWFAKALAVNPKDSNAMRNMGVWLSKQGKDADAISWFEKALAVKEDDVNTFRNYSVLKAKLGDRSGSLELIKKALKINPDNKDYQSVLQYISVKFKLDFESLMREIDPDSVVSMSVVDNLRWLVHAVREKFDPKIKEYKRKMDESEKRLSEFLGQESNIQPDRSLLLTLRKWNSYTPTIPSNNEERYVGGGYVIYHNGKAVVIDPGHNFIENFSHAGGMMCDIDAIVMTHAHSDHTNDFESLLTLIYEYNDRHGFKANNEKFKKIDIYLNVGAMKKFSGLLDLRSSDYIRNIVVMSHYSNYILQNGVVICPLPANHDELITKKYAVGLHVSIPIGSGKMRNVLFTSDTGLFPQIKRKIEGENEKTVANVEEKEIYKLYNEYSKDIDVLVPHLGSIKPQEIEAEIKASLEEVFYPNHLGILGTIRLVTAIAPRLVFVSEFGEELCEFRSELMELMQEVVDKYCGGGGPVPRVFPADTPLIYDIKSDEMYCVLLGSFQPAEKMSFKEYKGTFFYYNEDRKGELKRFFIPRSKVFCDCLQGRDKLYFAVK